MAFSRALAACLTVAATAALLLGAPEARQAPPTGQAQQPPAAGQQPAQQPQAQQPPTFRAGVQLVRVDVTVIGSGDKGVPDLTPEDFEVTEDGVPQKVQTAQFVRLTGQPGANDETSRTIRSREHGEAEAAREDVRLFVIFLDDYHIQRLPSITVPLRRELNTFISRLQPTDLVAIVDPLTPASNIEFTRDQGLLQEIVRKFEGRLGEIFPIKNAAEEAQLRSGDTSRLRAQVTLSALQSVCVRLGGLREGRKTVIFISQGPPLLFGSANLEPDIRDTVDAANRANVTIDTVDPRGLGSYLRAADSLYRLASETGGRTIVNTNNFELGLRGVVEDASTYYLIGYVPTRTEDDGKFHKISVKVKRSGVKVIHRSGYWAPSRKELDAVADAAVKPKDPGITNAMKALARSEPRGSVQGWVGFTKAPDGRTEATVTWEPAVPPPPTPIDHVELEVVPAGAKAPDVPATTIPAAAPGQPRPQVKLVLPPGDALARFVAKAADGSPVDRWEQQVTIPNLSSGQVALATPRFYVASSLPEVRAIQGDQNPAPRALRTFRQTDRVFVDLEIYVAAGAASLSVAAELLSFDGKGLLSFPITELNGGKARVELPVRGLGKGTYLFRVRAKAGESQVEDLTAFKVVP